MEWSGNVSAGQTKEMLKAGLIVSKLSPSSDTSFLNRKIALGLFLDDVYPVLKGEPWHNQHLGISKLLKTFIKIMLAPERNVLERWGVLLLAGIL